MTRRSDLMLEDLRGCTHEPEIPILEDDGQEVSYWLCRCGLNRCVPVAREPEVKEEEPK